MQSRIKKIAKVVLKEAKSAWVLKVRDNGTGKVKSIDLTKYDGYFPLRDDMKKKFPSGWDEVGFTVPVEYREVVTRDDGELDIFEVFAILKALDSRSQFDMSDEVFAFGLRQGISVIDLEDMTGVKVPSMEEYAQGL